MNRREQQRGTKWSIWPQYLEEPQHIEGYFGFKIENSTKDSNELYIFNVRLIPEEDVDDEEWPLLSQKFWIELLIIFQLG